MEAPLEFNEGLRKASAEGKLDNNPKFKAAVDAAPIKMISTAMPGVDPMTGMVQQNQFAPSAMNPTALGGLQNQIPNLVGQSVPGSFDRVLPQGVYNNAQEAITAKTNSRMAQALGGALSPFTQSTYGMLGAKTSKEAAEAERKRKEAQKKAKEEKEKKDKKNNKK
jgi:hypothetical protein